MQSDNQLDALNRLFSRLVTLMPPRSHNEMFLWFLLCGIRTFSEKVPSLSVCANLTRSTRATKHWFEGCIWPLGRTLDPPVLIDCIMSICDSIKRTSSFLWKIQRGVIPNWFHIWVFRLWRWSAKYLLNLMCCGSSNKKVVKQNKVDNAGWSCREHWCWSFVFFRGRIFKFVHLCTVQSNK